MTTRDNAPGERPGRQEENVTRYCTCDEPNPREVGQAGRLLNGFPEGTIIDGGIGGCQRPIRPEEAENRMACRDCGLGGTLDADGRWHGDRDVEPCPGGDDDFHHVTPAEPVTGFYVSVVNGSQRGLLVGPYVEHAYALAAVDRVRRAVVDLEPKAHFYGFGTARVDAEVLPTGSLNVRLGL